MNLDRLNHFLAQPGARFLLAGELLAESVPESARSRNEIWALVALVGRVQPSTGPMRRSADKARARKGKAVSSATGFSNDAATHAAFEHADVSWAVGLGEVISFSRPVAQHLSATVKYTMRGQMNVQWPPDGSGDECPSRATIAGRHPMN